MILYYCTLSYAFVIAINVQKDFPRTFLRKAEIKAQFLLFLTNVWYSIIFSDKIKNQQEVILNFSIRTAVRNNEDPCNTNTSPM